MQLFNQSVLPSLITLASGMLFFVVLGLLPFSFGSAIIGRYVSSVLVIFFLLWLSFFFIKRENIKAASVNLIPDGDTWKKLILGVILGAVIVSFMIGCLLVLTSFSLQSTGSTAWPLLIGSSLILIPLAFMEELLFRGYPFFRLIQLIHARYVILLTAVLFALYHYNGSQSLIMLLLGPGIWGVVFGVAGYLSNSVAVPLGIHFMANFIQALMGMKSQYVPESIWVINNQVSESSMLLNPDLVGITIQLMLLMVSLLVLELGINRRKKMPNEPDLSLSQK